MMDMDEAYTSGGMIYTLEDEDGKEQEFELLDEMDYGDASYCALVPYYEEKEQMLEDNGEFVILKREMIDGEEMLCTIEDDAEYETVGAMFLERLNGMFEDEDEEDEEA